jgi:hypothetical protein
MQPSGSGAERIGISPKYIIPVRRISEPMGRNKQGEQSKILPPFKEIKHVQKEEK